MTSELKSKVVNSSFWIFSFRILDQSLGFIRILILARLLNPTDFGLIGMAWLTLQIIDTFTQTGIQNFLVYQQKKVQTYLNASWTLLLFRGIGLYIIIFVLAPFIGVFFNNLAVPGLIRILCLILVFQGFNNIGVIYFRKNLAFKKQFFYDISGSITDFIVTIIFAYILKNYWAVIIGALSNQIVKIIMSYILSPYRPKLEVNLNKIKEISHYGKWITGSNILTFLYSQGDDILVGKILGTTSLGLYQLAYKISNMPATQVTHIISTVMFPAYSKLQNDLHKLSKAYLDIFQLTVFLSFFVGTGIILFAKEFVVIILGSKWLPIVASMQILTIWGVMRSISATTGPIWQAIGTPKIITIIQFLFVIILAILILPFTFMWNITGTSWAVVIASFIPNILGIVMISRTTYCKLEQLIKVIALSLLISVLSAGIIFALKNMIPISNIFSLSIMGIIFIISYLLFSYIVDRIFHNTMFETTLHILKSIPIFNKFILSRINNK